MSECSHQSVRHVKVRKYEGPVSGAEDHKARGDVCDEQQCTVCGARRFVNRNRRHDDLEFGPWEQQ